MKKLTGYRVVLSTLLCLLASFAAQAGTLTLRLASNHTDDFVTARACSRFADLVKERTKGDIVVECYFNAVLGDERAVAEQMQYGGVDFSLLNNSVLSEFVEEFRCVQLPFVYADRAHFWRVLDSEDIGMRLLRSEEMRKAGFYGLCYFDNGSRNFFFRDLTVRTPADMKGATVRVQESSLMIAMVRALGANPTAMPSSEIYGALQTGVIDGAENNLPYYLSQSFNEVAPKITMDEHTRSPDTITMSYATVKKLSPEQMAIIEGAARDASLWQRGEWVQSEIDSQNKSKELGCTIIELAPEEKRLFMDAVKEVNANEGKKFAATLAAIAAK